MIGEVSNLDTKAREAQTRYKGLRRAIARRIEYFADSTRVQGADGGQTFRNFFLKEQLTRGFFSTTENLIVGNYR